jgi:hypothetical protein
MAWYLINEAQGQLYHFTVWLLGHLHILEALDCILADRLKILAEMRKKSGKEEREKGPKKKKEKYIFSGFRSGKCSE